ncbi:hypothetical protein ACCT30_25020, partial [Rhizobium ruizarguesonis]
LDLVERPIHRSQHTDSTAAEIPADILGSGSCRLQLQERHSQEWLFDGLVPLCGFIGHRPFKIAADAPERLGVRR